MARQPKDPSTKAKQAWASLTPEEWQVIEDIRKDEKRFFATVCAEIIRLGMPLYLERRKLHPPIVSEVSMLEEGSMLLRSMASQ